MRLFWRSLVAFIILPGTVAFLVPWLLRPSGAQLDIAALPALAVGTALLLWCVRDFYVAGRGTLAPWAPPDQLVVVGLYRWSRNPMYVAVLTIVLGWAWAFHARGIGVYALVVATTLHVRVRYGEEPRLARKFGTQWTRYATTVPRWLR